MQELSAWFRDRFSHFEWHSNNKFGYMLTFPAGFILPLFGKNTLDIKFMVQGRITILGIRNDLDGIPIHFMFASPDIVVARANFRKTNCSNERQRERRKTHLS